VFGGNQNHKKNCVLIRNINMSATFPEPAQVDYLDERQVMLHMRSLLDLHDLLLFGYEYEMSKFRAKLLEIGWNNAALAEILHKAASYTRYENLIPHPIHGIDKNKH